MHPHPYGRIRRPATVLAIACAVAATAQSSPALASAQAASVPTTSAATASSRAPVAAATAVTPVTAAATGPRQGSVHTVTLITGDRVRITDLPGGKQAVAFTPGAGRSGTGFVRRTSRNATGGTDITILPVDVLGAVSEGRLDPRLFDVSELIRERLDDTASARLPLIVSYRSAQAHPGGRTAPPMSPQALRAAAAPLASVPGVRLDRQLSVLSAMAVSQDKRDAAALWARLAEGVAAKAPAGGTIAHIWLDARIPVADDESNAQIGVPVAWAAGLTGAGVKVAVLDTGLDTTHPDFTGVVVGSQDFTDNPNGVTDGFGHGTHVASIIAGSGAASGGRYRGVAPDAKLLIGKVCDDFGFCDDSAIIAGMQWAADQGARVANLSLGGTDNPGIDPVEQAVNDLTASADTLFVIAAGNDGGPVSVNTPGSADAALTVASVDKQDELSFFSSQGPRVGDDAMKPDIAAPGEDIIAARAAGTDLGDPVDQFYTSLSGTSMATPHVSGAAAILAQEHPDWTAAQLKAELMSTANPIAGTDDYGQGDGRVDVARAVTQDVYASTASVSFGLLKWPQDGLSPSTSQVSYANDGDTPVTLALAETATNQDGAAAPAGLFTLAADTVTVPAHGQASVALTVTPAAAAQGPAGFYSGRIEATAGSDRVEVAFGATVEPESYDVSMTLTDRDGNPASADLGPEIDIFSLGSDFALPPALTISDGKATARLPKGDYGFSVVLTSLDPVTVLKFTLMTEPLVHVDHAGITLDFDARKGRPVRATTDRPHVGTSVTAFDVQWTTPTPFGPFDVGFGIGVFARGPGQPMLFVAPAHGTAFKFTSHVQAEVESASGSTPRYVYQLAKAYTGRVPPGVDLHPHDGDLATVHSRYRTQDVAGMAVAVCPFPSYQPDQMFFIAYCATNDDPAQVTELYSPSPAVRWFQSSQVYDPSGFPDFDGSFGTDFESLAAHSVTSRTWNSAVAAPAVGDGEFGHAGVARTGDIIGVAVPMFAPNDPGELSDPFLGNLNATGSTTLSSGGTVIGSDPFVGSDQFTVPAAPAWYTLSVTAARSPAWSRLSPQVSAVWRFRSGHTDPDSTTLLPVMTVRMTGAFDAFDRAPAGAPFRLDLTPGVQAGGPASPVTAVTVSYSTNGGKTWHRATVTRGPDGGWHATIANPASGFVSLRVSATDKAGASVTETIIRAYGVK
ncbi:MAG TPA: S8 family peptidase [Micromonosporaceae bacterium]|nr:S8 family peptidase [Micromonosporaceae bacterium]